MGQSDSRQKIEEEFQIHKLQDNGNALLRSKVDDKDYLMRIVACTNQNDLQRLKTLLENRAQLKNHHLLSLVEIKQKRQDFICSIQYKMYLVLEYSFKNTAEQIKQRTKNNEPVPFQQSDLWSILYSCCTALQALYSNGISHQCLTADQIFINKDGFIKISEPMLFGLEKNHLEAMRTKDNGYVNVHLSPQIMNCLEDQNFFYYEKEKSDVFILAMIVVDLALLKTNYLYDVAKRRPNLEVIPTLLNKIGERYTSNLTSILGQMLRIDCKMRPPLARIIERVEKCNNIGDEFTLETETNLRSNDASSQKQHDKQIFDKPVKYKELHLKEGQYFLDQSSRHQPRVVQERVIVRVPEQPSFSINQQPSYHITQQNFDGKVFNTTPQQSYYMSQQPSYIQRDRSTTTIQYYQKSNQQLNLTQQTQQNITNQSIGFQSFRKQFDPQERSRSSESVKVQGFSQYSNIENLQPFSAAKPTTTPFTAIEPTLNYTPTSFKTFQPEFKKSTQPIFTHQIPEVYNIMIKSQKAKVDFIDKEKVSTPQFHGQIMKDNRFSSFKHYPQHEVVSRISEDDQSGLSKVQLKKNISHTQSQTYPQHRKKNSQLEQMARNAQSPIVMNTQYSFAPPQPPQSQHKNHHFSGSAAGQNTQKPLIQAGSAVSYSFSPGRHEFGRQSESKTCRSGFEHQSVEPDPDLQYVKEDIPDRGRYQGYKLYDMRSGNGVLHFKDGGYYDGQWKDDKMNGFGKLYYQNGAIAYEGHWQNDQFNGQGRVYNMEPVAFVEQFNYKDFSELGNKWIYYDGQFKSDSKHGKGYIKLTNGQMFEGLFDHDMIEGNGIFYKRSGEIIIGFWIDNKLFLNQSYQGEK